MECWVLGFNLWRACLQETRWVTCPDSRRLTCSPTHMHIFIFDSYVLICVFVCIRLCLCVCFEEACWLTTDKSSMSRRLICSPSLLNPPLTSQLWASWSFQVEPPDSINKAINPLGWPTPFWTAQLTHPSTQSKPTHFILEPLGLIYKNWNRINIQHLFIQSRSKYLMPEWLTAWHWSLTEIETKMK